MIATPVTGGGHVPGGVGISINNITGLFDPGEPPEASSESLDSVDRLTIASLPVFNIRATTSDDPQTIKDYFPVETAVNFTASPVREIAVSDYQWSVQKLFPNVEDITVSDNTAQDFSHAFDTRGLYDVTVWATDFSRGNVYRDPKKSL